MKFGFDVSGVLCGYSDNAMPNAIETVSTLLQQGHDVYTISGGEQFEGEPPRDVLQDYLDAGVSFTNNYWQVNYKGNICARLALDMFFDDSLRNISQVMSPTVGVLVPPSWDKCLRVPSTVEIARGWQEIRSSITRHTGVTF